MPAGMIVSAIVTTQIEIVQSPGGQIQNRQSATERSQHKLQEKGVTNNIE
jgi:hypothetical protein